MLCGPTRFAPDWLRYRLLAHDARRVCIAARHADTPHLAGLNYVPTPPRSVRADTPSVSDAHVLNAERNPCTSTSTPMRFSCDKEARAPSSNAQKVDWSQ